MVGSGWAIRTVLGTWMVVVSDPAESVTTISGVSSFPPNGLSSPILVSHQISVSESGHSPDTETMTVSLTPAQSGVAKARLSPSSRLAEGGTSIVEHGTVIGVHMRFSSVRFSTRSGCSIGRRTAMARGRLAELKSIPTICQPMP